MNCWQKCVKSCTKHKLLSLSFSFILIFLLLILVFYMFLPPLPKNVDIEIQRNMSASYCQKHLCIYKWIEKYQSNANLTQMFQLCPRYEYDLFINTTFELYQEKHVNWQFLEIFYYYWWYRKCHRNCGLDGPFRYFQTFLEVNQEIPKAWFRHKLCTSPFKTEYSCRWRGYQNIFVLYFAYFSIPLTFFINYLNLMTLFQLLGKKGAGAALYLHTAEIVTDGVLNIIVGLHSCLQIFHSIDVWMKSCAYYEYISVDGFMVVIYRFVSFLNQAYLMGLLADRLYAISHSSQYNNMSNARKKKRAKTIILNIFVGSFTTYFPFIIFYTFLPTIHQLEKISDFWKNYFHSIDFVVSAFYVTIGFSLLISQIVCGVFVEKKFRKFIKGKMDMNQESERELKKREREKQLLLIGTIGLNLITTLINAVKNTFSNTSFYKLLGYPDDMYPWWSIPLFMANPALTFINGNGALIIHIIFVKSYRKAFKATRFGRVVFGHPIHPTQPNA